MFQRLNEDSVLFYEIILLKFYSFIELLPDLFGSRFTLCPR